MDELVQTWCRSDVTHQPRGTVQEPRLTSRLAACDAATTRGNFLGRDASGPAAEGEPIFKDPRNLATAIASILSEPEQDHNRACHDRCN
ncbi:hypothetical protein [Bradyrhizobium sp. CB3481]|uniref:hypothetical protein n=1 Tax=Bradyrhizobium sp. CB3481 TaxID=3039158 RepID=UPI0024B0B4D3|nr:hypothetical protein [Bradyrhizobium sp. CB3481]WFU19446.1 hypothetical protein QA643_14500 [Bradyrhizobium sp. CB3481]